MTEIVRNNKNRCVRFEMRLTEDEHRKMESHAQARGTTISSLLRSAFLGHPLPERKTQIEAEAVAALNRVGSNINQIARTGNKSGTLTKEQVRALSTLYKATKSAVSRIEGAIE